MKYGGLGSNDYESYKNEEGGTGIRGRRVGVVGFQLEDIKVV